MRRRIGHRYTLSVCPQHRPGFCLSVCLSTPTSSFSMSIPFQRTLPYPTLPYLEVARLLQGLHLFRLSVSPHPMLSPTQHPNLTYNNLLRSRCSSFLINKSSIQSTAPFLPPFVGWFLSAGPRVNSAPPTHPPPTRPLSLSSSTDEMVRTRRQRKI